MAEVLAAPAVAADEEPAAAAAALPQPAGVAGSGADADTADAAAQWRCWCSHPNGDDAAACGHCATPRSAQTGLATTAAVDAAAPKDETKGEGCDAATATAALAPVYVLALVVRADLGMSRAKIAEQCCLATLSTVWRSFQQPAGSDVPDWRASGEEKVVLSCGDGGDAVLSKLCARAAVCGIETLAALEHGERTVLAVGPAPAADLELVIGELAPLDWLAVAAATELGGDTAADEKAEEDATEKRSAALSLLPRVSAAAAMAEADGTAGAPVTHVRKLKPNAKCHCGSAKKYKKCCAAKDVLLKQAHDELQTTVLAVLGKENAEEATGVAAGGSGNGSGSGNNNNSAGRGERVMAFRKQGEYGAKKYIKP